MRDKEHSPVRTGRMGLATIAAMVFCLIGTQILFAEKEDRESQLSTTRQALGELMEVQKDISREKHEFNVAREMLNQSIDVVKGRIESLRTRTDKARSEIAEQEKKRDKLKDRLAKLTAAVRSLDDTVETLETRTVKLLERLPARVREDRMISTLSKSFMSGESKSDDPNATADSSARKLPLSKRFQNVIGVLNRLNKLSRELEMETEIRELPDGSKAEVTTVYLGFGQAYYLGGQGSIAGVGRLGPDGTWVWIPANDAADRIARVIAILKDEKPAAFVQVPIEIR